MVVSVCLSQSLSVILDSVCIDHGSRVSSGSGQSVSVVLVLETLYEEVTHTWTPGHKAAVGLRSLSLCLL